MYETVYSRVGLNGSPVEEKIFRCSISTVPLIVGGEKAQAKEFPHMVTIEREKQTKGLVRFLRI